MSHNSQMLPSRLNHPFKRTRNPTMRNKRSSDGTNAPNACLTVVDLVDRISGFRFAASCRLSLQSITCESILNVFSLRSVYIVVSLCRFWCGFVSPGGLQALGRALLCLGLGQAQRSWPRHNSVSRSQFTLLDQKVSKWPRYHDEKQPCWTFTLGWPAAVLEL